MTYWLNLALGVFTLISLIQAGYHELFTKDGDLAMKCKVDAILSMAIIASMEYMP